MLIVVNNEVPDTWEAMVFVNGLIGRHSAHNPLRSCDRQEHRKALGWSLGASYRRPFVRLVRFFLTRKSDGDGPRAAAGLLVEGANQSAPRE